MFSSCQAACCQGDRLLLFPVCNLCFFYILLQPCSGVQPVDRLLTKPELYSLQPLDGNVPHLHFFFFLVYFANSQMICFTLRWKPGYCSLRLAKFLTTKKKDRLFRRVLIHRLKKPCETRKHFFIADLTVSSIHLFFFFFASYWLL